MSEKPGLMAMLSNPNVLTMSRIAAGPLIVILLLFPMNRVTFFLAALIFSAASITDYLDGYFARKYGRISGFGKAMDPLADKILTACAFIMLTAEGLIPGWVVCIIVGRELSVTGLRNILAGRGEDISASFWGKWKTGFQIGTLIPLLIHYEYFGIDFHALGMLVLWVAVALTIWSGVDYFVKARAVFMTDALS
jgi:CDP-diacylglycerol---glycerol-3-phosphate 3-phosphatidyltransferase